MAAMVRLLQDSQDLVFEIYNRRSQAFAARSYEYAAAVRIQAWFRGIRVRVYLKYLNNRATQIQKIWRGFLARKFYKILLMNTVFIMRFRHFNEMASKVQRLWRGYYVRKYIFNYNGRKRYLEALQVKNEIVRIELAEFAEQHQAARKREEERSAMQRREYEARRHHYLLSTEVIPGIYNSPFLPCPAEEEYLLRSVQPMCHKKKKANEPEFDPVCASYSSSFPKTLPPLANRPQGPFRDPKDVQKQRYKPFKPTLRVCTDFCSLEKAREKLKNDEWVQRINDNIFQPFSHQRTELYTPLLQRKAQFGRIPYGTKYFREETLDKNIVRQNFKTVIPPIPVFDKLNDTYSRGQI
ncbi:hypothetical protein BsWGS_10115 [Bradybaena similaris]